MNQTPNPGIFFSPFSQGLGFRGLGFREPSNSNSKSAELSPTTEPLIQAYVAKWQLVWKHEGIYKHD